ncbi:hypothetical protein B0H14DRAFT_2563420 [Mycena olivaceomarginata]|nr:hypothetical protein B0H14DRAFT_2563420 [Mycena olivaceomarginata]
MFAEGQPFPLETDVLAMRKILRVGKGSEREQMEGRKKEGSTARIRIIVARVAPRLRMLCQLSFGPTTSTVIRARVADYSGNQQVRRPPSEMGEPPSDSETCSSTGGRAGESQAAMAIGIQQIGLNGTYSVFPGTIGCYVLSRKSVKERIETRDSPTSVYCVNNPNKHPSWRSTGVVLEENSHNFEGQDSRANKERWACEEGEDAGCGRENTRGGREFHGNYSAAGRKSGRSGVRFNWEALPQEEAFGGTWRAGNGVAQMFIRCAGTGQRRGGTEAWWCGRSSRGE